MEDVSIKNKLKLFVWPLLSFGPLILFKLFFLNFSHKKLSKNIDISILLFSFSLLIISQSILQGYIISGKNIIRLTTMSFLPLLIFFQINSGLNKTKVNYKLAVFFIIVFIWSCHPTFSIFNFLENYRF